MIFRWVRSFVMLSALLLMLAGCFQQAGESLQPASNTAIPQSAPNIIEQEPSTDAATQPSGTRLPTTPTFPPLTVISQPSATPVLPSPTPLVAETPTPQQFITPISPLGPDVETSTPSLSGNGRTTTTQSGLITPTSFLISGGSVNCIYTVQPGDSLFRIAINNDTSVDAMREANPDLTGENPVLQPGQELILSDCTGEPSEEPDTEATAELEDESTAAAPTIPVPTPIVATTPGASTGETYIVQRGDTLFTIAQRFGTTVRAIQEANELSDPNRIDVGQELIIPAAP